MTTQARQQHSTRRYRTFPITKYDDEFRLSLGFPSRKAAEDWVDFGLRARDYTGPFLVEGIKRGAPGRPGPVQATQPD